MKLSLRRFLIVIKILFLQSLIPLFSIYACDKTEYDFFQEDYTRPNEHIYYNDDCVDPYLLTVGGELNYMYGIYRGYRINNSLNNDNSLILIEVDFEIEKYTRNFSKKREELTKVYFWFDLVGNCNIKTSVDKYMQKFFVTDKKFLIKIYQDRRGNALDGFWKISTDGCLEENAFRYPLGTPVSQIIEDNRPEPELPSVNTPEKNRPIDKDELDNSQENNQQWLLIVLGVFSLGAVGFGYFRVKKPL